MNATKTQPASKRNKIKTAGVERPQATTRKPLPPEDHSCKERLEDIPIDAIDPSPFQPRKSFDEDGLRRLADSMQQDKLLHRVVVRPKAGQRFELLFGERRWRAAKRAGWQTIPASIRIASDDQALNLIGVDFSHQAGLSPIEKAGYFDQLKRHGVTTADIAKRFNLSHSSVSNMCRLLRLPERIKRLVHSGDMPLNHGLALVPYGDKPSVVDAIVDDMEANPQEYSRANVFPRARMVAERVATFGAKGGPPVEPPTRRGRRSIGRVAGDTTTASATPPDDAAIEATASRDRAADGGSIGQAAPPKDAATAATAAGDDDALTGDSVLTPSEARELLRPYAGSRATLLILRDELDGLLDACRP